MIYHCFFNKSVCVFSLRTMGFGFLSVFGRIAAMVGPQLVYAVGLSELYCVHRHDDLHTNIPTGRHTDIHTDRDTGRHTERIPTYITINSPTDRCTWQLSHRWYCEPGYSNSKNNNFHLCNL